MSLDAVPALPQICPVLGTKTKGKKKDRCALVQRAGFQASELMDVQDEMMTALDSPVPSQLPVRLQLTGPGGRRTAHCSVCATISDPP